MPARDIVCLSTQDFDDLWTRKQRWMLRRAQNCRVLYVESQMHWITYFREFRRHWNRIARSRQGAIKRAPNLWVWTPPICLPFFQMSTIIAKLNNYLLWRSLDRQIKRLGLGDPILWLYTPYSADIATRMRPGTTVYECVDDFSAAKGLVRAKTVQALEGQTFSVADVTVVTSDTLAAVAGKRARQVITSYNASDTEFIAKAAHSDTKTHRLLDNIKRPVAGFVGAIAYWVDLDLLASLATARPDMSIVLVGPIRVNTKRYTSISNLHFLGRCPYEHLPEIMHGFDVCLNPYRRDAMADGASPLKLYEYLASRKPIVSTDMPEARRFSGVVRVATDDESFIEHVDAALAEDTRDRHDRENRQRELAAANSWEARFTELEARLEQHIPGLIERKTTTAAEGKV